MVWGSLGSDYLPPNDNAWLRMDHRTNRMVVTGVLLFDEPVRYDTVKQRFEDRLMLFDRFRQRLVEPWHGLRPRWEKDPHFDIENHLSHIALPEPQGIGELEGFVGNVMHEKLDDSKPLWHCWLVEGVGEDGGNAVVVRIHHALADGFALLYVLFSLADDPDSIELPMGELPRLPIEDEGENGGGDVDENDISGGTDPRGGKDKGTREGTGFVSKATEAVFRGVKTASSARSPPLRKEPETPLGGKLTGSKRVSWTDTHDLGEVKSTAHSYDGTVNDVLMASVAGAFRRYIKKQGYEVPDGLELTTAMPVNLKPLVERDEQLGNYFGLGFVELPVGTEDREERIRKIQHRTGMLKQGTEAYGMYALLNAAGFLPDVVQETVSNVFRNRITAAVTNVPGPLNGLELAGKEVTDIMFWAPTTEDIGIGISLFSYGGEVRVGVAVDKNVVPNPGELADSFDRELEEMIGTKTPEGKETEERAESPEWA